MIKIKRVEPVSPPIQSITIEICSYSNEPNIEISKSCDQILFWSYKYGGLYYSFEEVQNLIDALKEMISE